MVVSFHKAAVGAERVSRVYGEKLAARGMRFGSHHSGTISYEFVGNRLYLTVGLKKGMPLDGAVFPPPQLVEHFHRGLLEEFDERLTVHGAFKAKNLIPASVAFLLRASGGISGRKEIHRLLNDHVYADEVFVEDGYATPKVVQLWRAVPKAGIRIARSLPLFWGRPFSKHFSNQ
jgi:hypothetical protein